MKTARCLQTLLHPSYSVKLPRSSLSVAALACLVLIWQICTRESLFVFFRGASCRRDCMNVASTELFEPYSSPAACRGVSMFPVSEQRLYEFKFILIEKDHLWHVQESAYISSCEVWLVDLGAFTSASSRRTRRRHSQMRSLSLKLMGYHTIWRRGPTDENEVLRERLKKLHRSNPLTLGLQRPLLLYHLTCSFLARGTRFLAQVFLFQHKLTFIHRHIFEEYIKFSTHFLC